MIFRRLFRVIRGLLFVLICAALIAGAGLFALQYWIGSHYQRDTESLAGADLAVQPQNDRSVTNIALFGVDADNDGTRRADCIMVLSVDRADGQVKVTSLMRDSRVEIEGHGEGKLNHAYSYGGPALAIQTMNRNFGLNIQHYAQVDFSQMANLIGALGGVVVDVKENERKELNKFIGEYCRAANAENCPVEQAGVQTLNGIQAMSYGRIRKGGTGDDWGRVERQSVVLEAMFQRVRGMSPAEIVELAPKMLKYVTSDLSMFEITTLAVGLLRHGMPEIDHGRIPVDRTWDYGGKNQQYIVFDLDKAAARLHDYIYEDIPLRVSE